MHYLIKEFAPPIVNTLRWFSFKYGWKGNFKSFEKAQEKCQGYDETHILNKIIETTNKVKNGEAVYERDGIIYDKIKINFPLVNALLHIASINNNKLTLIDFGGSLGTSYYQNIGFLKQLVELNWCIIEQKHFVKIGKKSFENEHIKFYYSMEECLANHKKPDLVLISSSLQYIKNPYDVLSKIQSFNIPFIMLDLVGYSGSDQDRITIQHVPPVFYGIEASYPCTFFGKSKIEKQMEINYRKEFDFISEDQKYYINFRPFRYQGSFWKLK